VHSAYLAGAIQAQEWKLVWSDEFDTEGKPDSNNWNYEHGFVRNEELQWYQADNANCKNGLLIIEGVRKLSPIPATMLRQRLAKFQGPGLLHFFFDHYS
jgi:hypothetical protein